MVTINESLDLETLRTKILEHETDKTYALLDLSNNRIRFIHNIFMPWCQTISVLKLNNCNLLTIERDTFNSLENLEVLFLNDNSLTLLPSDLFQSCDRLKNLSLRNNKIGCFQAVAFKRIKNLRELDLSFNFLKQITYTQHDTLEILKLNNNLIEMFYGNLYTKLFVLNLSFNRLKNIVSTTSKNMPAITEIDLSNNEIAAIKQPVFKHAPKLQTLRLNNNRLVKFTTAILASGCFLKCLELDGNCIMDLILDEKRAIYLQTFSFAGNFNCKFNSFGMLVNLKRLNLSGCTFHLDILPHLINSSALEHFNFADNRIHKIPNGYFFSLTKLTFLSLENSEPECLSGLTEPLFGQDNSLKRLIMSGCGLENVTSFFRFLSHLTYLNLARNKIVELDRRTFVDLTQLKYLYLNRNELTGFQPQTFRTLINLKTVDLTANPIVELNRRQFEHCSYLNNLWIDQNVCLYDEPNTV